MLPHTKASGIHQNRIPDSHQESELVKILKMYGLFGVLDDPKFKTLNTLPHSKECGFKFMDIKRLEKKNKENETNLSR